MEKISKTMKLITDIIFIICSTLLLVDGQIGLGIVMSVFTLVLLILTFDSMIFRPDRYDWKSRDEEEYPKL